MAGEPRLMKHDQEHPCLVQLVVLNEHRPPLSIGRADLPVRIGRAADCQLRLEVMGVWDHHVEMHLDCAEGFLLRPVSEASTLVNDEPLKTGQRLDNGDVISLGEVKVQFRIGPVRQLRLGAHETLCWLALAAFAAAQMWLILWLG